MIDLRGNPFFLNDAQVAWVESTLASMTGRPSVLSHGLYR